MSQELIRSINTLTDKVSEFSVKDNRRRVQMLILTVSVVLDLVLSGLFFYGLHQTNGVLDQVRKNNSAIVSACKVSNEQNIKQHEFWDSVISKLPKAKDAPATDPAQLLAFNQLLDKTFPQTDCSALIK